MTFGKAIAGGLPMSAVAGRGEIIDQVISGGGAFGGTFNGNSVSTAAALATLAELSRQDGEALVRTNRLGQRLMFGLSELAGRHGFAVHVTGFGAAFSLHFTARQELRDYRDTLDDDRGALERFLFAALERGVLVLPDGRFYVSAAHTDNDVEETLEVLESVFSDLL
jgi:glutamate-1-semialdehyde 2,1-aminomutase